MIWWIGAGALLLAALLVAYQGAKQKSPNYWRRWDYCHTCRAQAHQACVRRARGGYLLVGRRHAWRRRMGGRP